MRPSPNLPDDGEQRVNLLAAYPYLKGTFLKVFTENQHRIRFVLDSGAFTAWRMGKPIALDDYCRFIEAMPFKPWRYFTLDVIGDAKATLKNYDEMLRRGFTPVPIFTRGESPSVLDHYYSTSDVVGIGGLVGTQGNMGFVNGIMKRVGARRVHFLGFTRMEYLKAYGPYMCDTASWEYGARMGSFKLYVGDGKSIAVHKKAFSKRPPEAVLKAIASYGVDPLALAKDANWYGGYSVNRTLNAASVVRLAMDVERNLGTKFFCATGAQIGLNLLLRGFEREQQRGKSQ